MLSRVVLLLFKHIFDPDFTQRLPGIIALMREILEQERGLQALETLLRYITSAAENITQDEIQTMLEKELSEKGGTTLMTLVHDFGSNYTHLRCGFNPVRVLNPDRVMFTYFRNVVLAEQWIHEGLEEESLKGSLKDYQRQLSWG